MNAAAVRAESVRLRREAQRLRDDAVAHTNTLLARTGERGAGGRGENFRLRLPRMAAAVGVARTAVERWLAAHGVPDEDTFSVVLATSEACANAVEHPCTADRPAFLVTGRCDRTSVEIAVQDFGRWRDAPSDEARGRGLVIIHTLMDEVEVEETAVGTAIRMSRRIRGRL